VDFTGIGHTVTVIITVVVDVINITLVPTIIIIDGTISVLIPVGHNVGSDIVDIITSPSTWAFSRIVWTGTFEMLSTWALFINNRVVIIDNTLVDFTGISGTRTVIITVLVEVINISLRPTIFGSNYTITISIYGIHNFNGDIVDFITSPSSSAYFDGIIEIT